MNNHIKNVSKKNLGTTLITSTSNINDNTNNNIITDCVETKTLPIQMNHNNSNISNQTTPMQAVSPNTNNLSLSNNSIDPSDHDETLDHTRSNNSNNNNNNLSLINNRTDSSDNCDTLDHVNLSNNIPNTPNDISRLSVINNHNDSYYNHNYSHLRERGRPYDNATPITSNDNTIRYNPNNPTNTNTNTDSNNKAMELVMNKHNTNISINTTNAINHIDLSNMNKSSSDNLHSSHISILTHLVNNMLLFNQYNPINQLPYRKSFPLLDFG